MFEIVVKEIHHPSSIYIYFRRLIGSNLTLFVGHLSNVWVVRLLVEFQTVLCMQSGICSWRVSVANSQ